MSEDKSVVDIVTERMERFWRDPVNYDGPFSGITYGESMPKSDLFIHEEDLPIIKQRAEESAIDERQRCACIAEASTTGGVSPEWDSACKEIAERIRASK